MLPSFQTVIRHGKQQAILQLKVGVIAFYFP